MRPRATGSMGLAIGNATAEQCELARQLRHQLTPAEKTLWQHLRANRLDDIPFHRQVAIRGFIVDFYCPRYRLVVEVDGAVHDGQNDYDIERTAILGHLGIRVIRFSNEDVLSNMAGVKSAIKVACVVPDNNEGIAPEDANDSRRLRLQQAPPPVPTGGGRGALDRL
jgi:very-short-patch-repair endonuclease